MLRPLESFMRFVARMYSRPVTLALAVFVLAHYSTVRAQVVTPATQQGSPINTSDDEHGVESINTMGLGLHIEIPLVTLQERGQSISWKYVYDTPTYAVHFYAQPTPQSSNNGNYAIQAPGSVFKSSYSDNWRLVSSQSWQLIWDTISDDGVGNPLGCTASTGAPVRFNSNDQDPNDEAFYVHYVNFRLLDPDGGTHPLPMEGWYYTSIVTDDGGAPAQCSDVGRSVMSGPTMDGSGAYVDLAQNAFWLKDGTKFNLRAAPADPTGLQYQFLYGAGPLFPTSIEDRNGNYLLPPNGNIAADAFGRGLALVGGDTTHDIYQYKDSTGTPRNITITYAQIPIATHDCDLASGSYLCFEYTDSGGSGTRLPTSLQLPDGSAYTFAYNSPGTHLELSRLTIPTGAEIDYTYQRLNDGNAVPRANSAWFKYAVATRTEHTGSLTNLWQYSGAISSYGTTIITDPGNNCTEHAYGALTAGDSPLETTITYKQGCGTNARVLKTVQTDYEGDPLTEYGITYWNTRPIRVTTTLANGQSTKRETSYDSYAWNGATLSWINPTQVREYNFGQATPTRTTSYSYLYQVGSASHSAADYASRHILDRVAKITVTDASGPLNSTTYTYDDSSHTVSPSGALGRDAAYGNWGNATAKIVKDEVSGTAYTSNYWYENTGSLIQAQDPLGHSTFYSYADAWNDASCEPPQGGQAHLYVTQMTVATGATTHYNYNSCTGSIASIADPNNVQSKFLYDTLGRTTAVEKAVGTPVENWTSYSYPDPNHILVAQDKDTKGDGVLQSSTVYDGLGRLIKQIRTNGASIDKTYDEIGRAHSISNPYYSGGDSNQLTLFTYDPIDRKTSETAPDGTIKQWCYDGIASGAESGCEVQVGTPINGTWVDYTDESGRRWQHLSDAFGNLRKVIEPGSLETDYGYNTLNNLTSVTQVGNTGTMHRSFNYDSLSRLLSSTNPETDTISYSYSANNGLCAGDISLPCTKTDARGIAINYTYDVLNRVTVRQSAGGSGVAGFNYSYGFDVLGTAPYLVGRLAWTSNNVNATQTYSYDPMGRLTGHSVGLPSNYMPPWTKSVVSTYHDLAGDLTDLTYPDGRHIKQTWDGAGQLSSTAMVDFGGVPQIQIYLTSASYNPDGSPNVLTLGNGVQQTIGKNNRLQVQSSTVNVTSGPLSGATLLSHTYCYMGCTTGGTANNGNIWGITDTLKATNTQGFTYDSLNRISSFSLGNVLNQQYAIDSFGNISSVVGGTAVTSFDPATNRINNLPCASAVAPYDAAGNQLCSTDSNGAVSQYSYNADGQISQIALVGYAGSPFVTYTYDPNGDRILKNNASGTYTEYIYSGGQPLTELNSNGTWTDYIYADGQKIAKVNSTETRLHTQGTFGSSGQAASWALSGPVLGYTIQPHDKLVWKQYQTGTARGGIALGISAPTTWMWLNWIAFDADSQMINSDGYLNVWHNRVVDLDSFAGSVVSIVDLVTDANTGMGAWNIWYKDIVLISANGTTTPIYTGQIGLSLPAWTTDNPANQSQTVEVATTTPSGSALSGSDTTNYYLDDHLGTTQMELSAGGWPVWEGQFMPFGQEIVNGAPLPLGQTDGSSMHYKFTGKERDTESGLDYFGARYYASSMGRFMSADPVIITPERLANPQQLNLYAYVANNPLRYIDPTGEVLRATGNQQADYNDLCAILGDACANRLSIDAKTGDVSFNTGAIGDGPALDLSKNEGAALVNDLVNSKNTYEFSEGPTMMTDKGPVKIDQIHLNLPTFGDQAQIGKPQAGVADVVGFNWNDKSITRITNTTLGVAVPYTVVFHELAEAYSKIDGGNGGSYMAGHNAALQREQTLRDQRPYLKQNNTGAGGAVNAQGQPANGRAEGGIIIKR